MPCPRCGHEPIEGLLECPRCGVVFAKLLPSTHREEPSARRFIVREAEPPAGGSAFRVVALVTIGLGFAWAAYRTVRTPPPPAASPELVEAAEVATDALPTEDIPELPPPPEVAVPDIPIVDAPASTGLSVGDVKSAARLAQAIRSRERLDDADTLVAESLLARYPDLADLRSLVFAVLRARATQQLAARRFDEGIRVCRRAMALGDGSADVRALVMRTHLDSGDWTAAEAAAREALAVDPRRAEALEGLGFALLRLDRVAEAIEALRQAVEVGGRPASSALLERARSRQTSQSGMTEERLAYFHVSYNGDAHVEVGHAILAVLERHRSTLVRTFDAELASPVPVVLFSAQSYYDATGAPAWSGGIYENLDGRISLPIGGLTPGLDSRIESILLHELAHAFMAQISRGVAPRELHEGMAQYLEGRRSQDAGEPALGALVTGRMRGVSGFYLGALSFVEYLIAERGQGGINDLLKAMGETGSSDRAFDRVYGRNFPAAQRAWGDWLRLRH